MMGIEGHRVRFLDMDYKSAMGIVWKYLFESGECLIQPDGSKELQVRPAHLIRDVMDV